MLEENGIKPDLVAGTSAGSLVAALYASGKTGAELAALADSMDESAFTDWSFPGRGLIRGEGLAKYVRDHTGGLRIEQMRVPLGIVATDLDSGEGILFQRGDPGVAVRASRMLLQTFAIMGRRINSFELRDADVLLRPKLPHVSGADFTARKRAIQAGREAMQSQLAQLRERIAAKTH